MNPILKPDARGLPLSEVKRVIGCMGHFASDRLALWHAFGARCFWCDRSLNFTGDHNDPRLLTIDHVNARNSGGDRHSKVASCRKCNQERGSLSAEDYWVTWSVRLVHAA